MNSILQKLYTLLSAERKQALLDAGLLVLRVSIGGIMLISHGWPKLAGFAEKSAVFPDPLGVGSTLSLALAVGAEVFCSIALILGLGTRFAAIPLIVTMLVAAFIVHADDPWQKKEFAILFLIPYVVLLLTGPGKFSLDEKLARKANSS